jgi:hypothetical protein
VTLSRLTKNSKRSKSWHSLQSKSSMHHLWFAYAGALLTLQLSRLQSIRQPPACCPLPCRPSQQAMQQHRHRPHAAAGCCFAQRKEQCLDQRPALLQYALLQLRLVCLQQLCRFEYSCRCCTHHEIRYNKLGCLQLRIAMCP